MEEEGIYYYFNHKGDSHQMVVSDKASFPKLEPAELIYQQAEGTHVEEERITRWQKRQQLRSTKVTLRDYHFQMPQHSLEAGQEIQDEVKVGKDTHKLRVGESDELEIYDWPGEYAHRFDAIDRPAAPGRPDEAAEVARGQRAYGQDPHGAGGCRSDRHPGVGPVPAPGQRVAVSRSRNRSWYRMRGAPATTANTF